MKVKKRVRLSTMTIFFALLLGLAVMITETETVHAEIQKNEEGVYLIGTYAELKEFADLVNSGYTNAWAKLTNDIDATGESDWTPIGTYNNSFSGSFDGLNHKITGLKTPDDYSEPFVGLFGCSAGRIINTGVVDNSFTCNFIESSHTGFGGVVGSNDGLVENCYNTGTVSANNNHVGGVAGNNTQYGTITKCYNTGTVSGSSLWTGGVAGCNDKGTITKCYNTGTVNGVGEHTGGVAGTNSEPGAITNCYNAGMVKGNEKVGGVAGSNNNGTITNCYNTGTLTGRIDVGGVTGYMFGGKLSNCYYDSDKVKAASPIGQSTEGSVVNVLGKKTAEMTGTDCTSYNNWESFDENWDLTEEYPLLKFFVYTARWLNGDDTVLDSKKFILSDDPPYTEKIPVKKTENGKKYTFEKWDAGTIADRTITYKPIFTFVHVHKYGVWTRINADQHQRVCEYDKTHIEKEKHKWDAGKVTKAATEHAEGVRTYTCTVCKATKTQTIPKLKSKKPSLKMKAGKKSMTLCWNKIKGADGYDIFFARCNHNHKKIVCKKVKNIKGNKKFKWKKTGLKKGAAYKSYFKAYVIKNGKKKYIYTSPAMYAYTGNGNKKYTNAKSVSLKNVKKGKLTLKKGKTFKIKAKVNKVKKNKKLFSKDHAPTLRYMTSDKKIATVSSKGKIKAVAKGKCCIYAYAHNGVSKSIKVTVK